MRINLLFTIFMVLVALAFIFVSDQAESLDITKIVNGTVKETNENSIKILEEPNSKVVQIAIDSNTVYDNVQDLQDINEGDKVQIDYDQSKKSAVTITRIEPGNEDSV